MRKEWEFDFRGTISRDGTRDSLAGAFRLEEEFLR